MEIGCMKVATAVIAILFLNANGVMDALIAKAVITAIFARTARHAQTRNFVMTVKRAKTVLAAWGCGISNSIF
jgi:hypothetical protein